MTQRRKHEKPNVGTPIRKVFDTIEKTGFAETMGIDSSRLHLWTIRMGWRVFRYGRYNIRIHYQQGIEQRVFEYLNKKFVFSKHERGLVYTALGLGKRYHHRESESISLYKYAATSIPVSLEARLIYELDKIVNDGLYGYNRSEVMKNILREFIINHKKKQEELKENG